MNSESDGASSIPRIEQVRADSNEIGSSVEDKEHELLMARLDELEAAEAAANWAVSNPSSSGDATYLQPPEHDYDQFVTNDRLKIGDNGVKELTDYHGESLKGRPSLRSPGDILKVVISPNVRDY